MNRLVFILPVMLALSIMGYLFFGLSRDAKLLPSALINQPVPNMEIGALYPNIPAITANALADNAHYKLVNVFASWCGPCRLEHGFIKQLASNKNLIIMGINWKDGEDKAKEYLTELGNPYQYISADKDGRYGVEWGVYGVPENFLVDKNGVIIWKFVGPLGAEQVKTIYNIIGG